MKKGVISVISALAGAAIGAVTATKVTAGKKEEAQAYSAKCIALFQMMNKWVKVKQEGKDLAAYLEKEGYKKIAIYGMSFVGETLLNELKDTGVQVAYGIDKNADSIYTDVDVVTAEDNLEDVDIIIVTAITFFDEIEEKLRDKVSCRVISLEDVIYEVDRLYHPSQK